MANDERLEKMVVALLKSENLIYWVNGYVYGETSRDDPYILLYPAQERLREKVCRVYPHDFKKLPTYIPTENISGDVGDNPSKDVAQRKGVYHECPPFEIVLFNGKDTKMGEEKRFSDVTRLSRAGQKAADSGVRPSPAPPPPAKPLQAPVIDTRGINLDNEWGPQFGKKALFNGDLITVQGKEHPVNAIFRGTAGELVVVEIENRWFKLAVEKLLARREEAA